jgi:cytochrome c oxidase subunit II
MNKLRLSLLLPSLFVVALSSVQGAYAQDSTQVIPIVAKKFGYTPNEIHLKKGEMVTLVLTTEDVAHGLKSKDLQIDALIKPGEETKVMVMPQTAGTFTAYCNKFCGAGHFGMKMKIIVE